MDFRVAPLPSELTWSAPVGFGKTKTAGATFGGKKIVVQTPPFKARMFKDPRSTTLYLSLAGGTGPAFAKFVESYETFVSENLGLGEPSSCLRNGSFRVTAWDDAQWFDCDRTYMKEPPTSLDVVIVSMEFGGCWISGGKWGLKWRIRQIKLAPSNDGPSNDGPSNGYAFVDDS
jgi:hypothetical protein